MKERLIELEGTFEKEYATFEESLSSTTQIEGGIGGEEEGGGRSTTQHNYQGGDGKKNNNKNNMSCLSIPTSIELIGTALTQHYYNGGTNLKDYATYDNGGSVVYELTSASYAPPARNNGGDDYGGKKKSDFQEVEALKQSMYDIQMEEMYYGNQQQQRSIMKGDDASSSSLSILDTIKNFNVYKWYTLYKFDELRSYLPQDWERLLDSVSSGMLWSEYTPRGLLDVAIPDYIYHAFGLSNEWGYARTVSPEVVISNGGDGGRRKERGTGYTAKPMGQCYPLSMRMEDDPALSLLSRTQGVYYDGGEESDMSSLSSLLTGPKYTVRLPHPIYIDAVSIEHRSFPLPREILESGTVRGGESAPRWVRVVGFPPCPRDKKKNNYIDEDCGVRGFDISKPIDLGSFEYHRITVTGREDDYGSPIMDDDEEEEEEEGGHNDPFSNERRRRSIQTFGVKGGQWKPTSLLGNDEALDTNVEKKMEDYDSQEARQCPDGSTSCYAAALLDDDNEEEEEESLPVGQCAPPKDEDSEPSCGGDSHSDASSSSSKKRQIVEAVSFIIEENWGKSEYTCLYRVRVHGDAVML